MGSHSPVRVEPLRPQLSLGQALPFGQISITAKLSQLLSRLPSDQVWEFLSADEIGSRALPRTISRLDWWPQAEADRTGRFQINGFALQKSLNPIGTNSIWFYFCLFLLNDLLILSYFEYFAWTLSYLKMIPWSINIIVFLFSFDSPIRQSYHSTTIIGLFTLCPALCWRWSKRKPYPSSAYFFIPQ